MFFPNTSHCQKPHVTCTTYINTFCVEHDQLTPNRDHSFEFVIEVKFSTEGSNHRSVPRPSASANHFFFAVESVMSGNFYFPSEAGDNEYDWVRLKKRAACVFDFPTSVRDFPFSLLAFRQSGNQNDPNQTPTHPASGHPQLQGAYGLPMSYEAQPQPHHGSNPNFATGSTIPGLQGQYLQPNYTPISHGGPFQQNPAAPNQAHPGQPYIGQTFEQQYQGHSQAHHPPIPPPQVPQVHPSQRHFPQATYYPQAQAVYNTNTHANPNTNPYGAAQRGPLTMGHVMESQMSLMTSLNMASQLRGGVGMFAGQQKAAVPRHLTLSAKERQVGSV